MTEPAAFSPTYPDDWRAVVRQVRVLVMQSDQEPTQADWEGAEVLPPDREDRAIERADELVRENDSFDRVVWVYAGHNGPYAPGVWKWWLRIGPPGWISEREQELLDRERERAAQEREKAEAARVLKAQKDADRRAGKLAPRFDATDTIVSGTAGKVTQRTIDSEPLEGWERYDRLKTGPEFIRIGDAVFPIDPNEEPPF